MIRLMPGLVVFAACAAFAQIAAPAPVFEVASVKPAAPTNLPDFWCGMDPAQFSCTHITLKTLLLRAYDLRSDQLAGPSSIDGERYDITAKMPPGATKEQFNPMLQNLLVERFGLAVHREMRDLPYYELVVAKGGPKLKDPEKAPAGEPSPAQAERAAGGSPRMSRDKDGLPMLPPGIPRMMAFPLDGTVHVLARMQTVARLLNMLEPQMGRKVVDKTGLTGTYDFSLFFAPDPAKMVYFGPPAAPEPPSGQAGVLDAVSDPAPTLPAALESQLGLKLESKKGPVEVLVIDKVNRTPTEN